MWFYVRRFVLGLAATLLVLGWGLTRYADAQLEAVSQGKSEAIAVWAGERMKPSQWTGNGDYIAGKTWYTYGIMFMSIGAALVVFAFPRGSWQPGIGH